MNDNRLTHTQIRSVCRAEGKSDFVTCPACGGHLHLFGADEFDCKGNREKPPCDEKVVTRKLWEKLDRGETYSGPPLPKATEEQPSGSFELAEYGLGKHLSAFRLLNWFAMSEGPHPIYKAGVPKGVCMPYLDEKGVEVTQQWRWGWKKGQRRFLPNKPVCLYGGRFFKLLEDMAKAGSPRPDIFLPEGESNCHTFAEVNLPALARPGVGTWKKEWTQLQCLQKSRRLYVPLDMAEDGKPEPVALHGALKIAQEFSPGKVLALRIPQKEGERIKDISDLWVYHKGPFGGDVEGFMEDLREAIMAAKPVIPPREEVEGLPPDLGDAVFKACPIIRDFVERSIPSCESDVNNLIITFLACAGTAIGRKAYAISAKDIHPPAPFYVVIANTASGKGTAYNVAAGLFKESVSDWDLCVRRSVRSQAALYRLVATSANKEFTFLNKSGAEKTRENKACTGGRLLVRFAEIAAVFKTIRAEWSYLAEGMREVYDANPISNERGQANDSIVCNEPYSCVILGDVTPWELQQVIQGVDFRNGIANRFLWSYSRQTKMLARPPVPDYGDLPERLRAVIPSEPVGEIDFSEAGLDAWETWVSTLPLDDGTKLTDACGRARANALRLCVLFSVLDEARMAMPEVSPKIEARHVQGAAAMLQRHRDTVNWFLTRPVANMDAAPENGKHKLWRQIEKVQSNLVDGRITGNALYRLFSNCSVDVRREIAEAAGLHLAQERDAKGYSIDVWVK